MTKQLLSTLVLAIAALMGTAQDRQISLQQAVLGQGSEFRPKNLLRPAWRPAQAAFTYVERDALVQQQAANGRTDTLINRSEINALLKAKELPTLSTLTYTWHDAQTLLLRTGRLLALLDLKQRTITHAMELPKGGHHTPSPNLQHVAYTVANNLHLLSKGGASVAITAETDPGIVCGQSVHRSEFGINGGIFWSPKSNLLAYYRMDERMVTNYPLVDITQRIAELNNVKYPMAGMKSHEVTLQVYNLKTKQTVAIQTGEPREQYLTNIAWSPDEQHIYIAVLNREQNHMRLNRYNAATGELEATLFEETNPRYVEPQHAPMFLEGDNERFVWQSRRDGWNHLYIYNATTGKLERQLTKGSWEVTDVLGYDAKQRQLYLNTTIGGARERHTISVSLKNGAVKRLTTTPGTHRVLLSSDFAHYLDIYSTISIPNVVNLHAAKGNKLMRNIITAPNPYEGYSNVSLPELVTLKNANGDTLYGRIIKPKNMEPNRRYPVVLYVYGGPHLQLVTNSWFGGARLWESYMANKGYILFSLDNRGTPYRGAEFEQTIHRRLGVCEMEDQLVGIDYLRSLPYVDANRIGVHGWSFGGFMTTSLTLKHADIFKVGVAGGAVTDWKFYEIMYGERYMDTPDENPEGYRDTDLKNHVDKLKGHLLLIHDDQDDTVVPQHSLSLIDEFIKHGKPVDFFIYPRHGHNVIGKDRVHLIDKVIRYFEDYL